MQESEKAFNKPSRRLAQSWRKLFTRDARKLRSLKTEVETDQAQPSEGQHGHRRRMSVYWRCQAATVLAFRCRNGFRYVAASTTCASSKVSCNLALFLFSFSSNLRQDRQLCSFLKSFYWSPGVLQSPGDASMAASSIQRRTRGTQREGGFHQRGERGLTLLERR